MSFHLEQQYPNQHADGIERDQCAKSNLLLTLSAAGFMLIAGVVTVFSLYLTFILQWQGPFRDLWEFVDDIERQFQGEWSWHYLLEAYGGAHRIFLPKLLFFADYFWLGGRNNLTLATALLCQIAYCSLIIGLLRKQSMLSTAERIILTATFALALFSTTQINNFLYAMDVQWYMSNLFGLISLYGLAQCPRSPKHWAMVLGGGITAALCNFTGLMVFPVAALALLSEPSRNHWRWPMLIVIAAICLAYVSHEKNSQQFIFSALQRSDDWQTTSYIVFDTLQKMIPYLFRYLASPLSRDWVIAGYCLSTAGIALTLYFWMLHAQDSQKLSSWQRLCLYLSTVIIASAFFTAFGRIIYPNSATAERYQTLVLPWLPCLFGLILPTLRSTQYRLSAVLGWTALYSFFLLPSQISSARDMVILSTRVNMAHTAARAGVLEPPYITATLSYPLIKNGINSVKDNDAFLRSHSLGYFQHLPQFAISKKIEGSSTLPDCTGYAVFQDTADKNSNSHIMDGQLLHEGKPVSDIVLLQQDHVVGLGLLIGSDDSLRPATWQPADSSRFRAYARKDNLQADKPLLALGIQYGEAVCQYRIGP